MKTALTVVSLMAAIVIAGTIVYLNGKKPPPASAADAATASGESLTGPPRANVPREEPAEPVLEPHIEAAQTSTPVQSASEEVSAGVPGAAPTPTPFSRAIDTLVSSQATFQQKHEAWRQLQDARQLDQAIEALKKGATENPASAAYPAALGQAQLYKAGELSQSGGTISEMGILGMQADQNFDASLKLDPANWEAQFFKAAAMHHWPLELNKGQEVIQRLASLIDQQDATAPQPQFAQAYVVLGDQYTKMGQSNYALATWQLGAQKFPANQELQRKIRGN
jgi:hypothetical protein